MAGSNGPLLTFLARRWKVILVATVALAAAFSAMVAAGYFLSTRPSFCSVCHYEEPFVAEWKTSRHKDVPCSDCHNAFDLGGTIAQQARNAKNTLKYLLGTFEYVPRAEVRDENCLQAGCHDGRKLTGPVKFEGRIDFDHKGHLDGPSRGLHLRCVSCHSRIVQGEHMAVTREACYICHFKDMPKGVAIAGCKCHGFPDAPVERKGFMLSHDKFAGLGMKCSDCHLDVTKGDGGVPPGKCRQCHLQRDAEKVDRATVHETHVSTHSIPCDRCHTAIDHRQARMVRTLEVSCATCHVATHDPHREMYMGVGAKGVEPYPDMMFKAQVGCDGCHQERRPGGVAAGETMAFGTRAACVACHGEGYDAMLDGWQAELRRATAGVQGKRDAAKEALGSIADATAAAEARERFERADWNLAFLARGRGEHNILYAERILAAAQSDLDAVVRAADPAVQTPDALGFEKTGDTRCTQVCHTNMDRIQRVRHGDLELSHRDHIEKHGLLCTYCHDNTRRHGEVRLKKQQCLHCHHTQEEAECGRACHRKQAAFIRGEGGFDAEATPDAMAGQVGCAECHVGIAKGNDPAAIREACVECHDEKYRAMADSWRTEIGRRAGDAMAAVSAAEGARSVPMRMLIKAKGDVSMVVEDRSKGAHNPAFARKLLDAAARLLKGEGEKDAPAR